MTQRPKLRAHGRSRMTGYAFDEATVERLLACVKASGVVAQYDAGRGGFVWFNEPAVRLRAVRAAARAEAGPLTRAGKRA